MGPGCYIVLPVLGPSTLRDTAGSFANVLGGDPGIMLLHMVIMNFKEKLYLTSKALSGINFRADNLESIYVPEKNSMIFASVKSLHTKIERTRLKIIKEEI